ncbi:MAG TPA: serpin family protein, partial [Gemmatimonadaceae bacterium]|nr:serpin family protein [Gemmatimonadaceae bacterium]
MSRSAPILRYILLPALAFTLSCAGGTTEPGGGDAPPLLDALPRPLTAGEQSIVGAANDFSFSLFKAVNSSPDSNVFTSPLSASFALGMTMNGAAGTTYDQMRSALGFGTTSEAEINGGYKGLVAMLRGLDPQVDLRIANSIWYDKTQAVNPSFVETSRNYFDAQVTALVFSDPASVTKINDWVSAATAQKIPKIVDALEQDLVMVLVNAIYFKGSWRERFDPAQTIDAPFHGVAGDQPAKLMHRTGTMGHLSTTDYDAVDLPYGNSAFTMTVVLPQAGTSVEAVASSLQSEAWSTAMGQLRTVDVDLYLPRFRMEWSRTMNDDLKSLGMRDAFVDGGADFSRIAPNGLFISYVKQKSYVDVNEEGTEAAAATAVGISVTSAPQ